MRDEIVTYIGSSHARVEELYRIDRDHGFWVVSGEVVGGGL